MIVDGWLDAGEKRPLLLIAASWHEMPVLGSTEGASATLLAPADYPLPEAITPAGTLHRPVSGPIDDLGDVLANAVLWGRASAPSISQAWLSQGSDASDTALLHAIEQAQLSKIRQREAQRRLNDTIGNAGVASQWLAMVGAIESGAPGPHLILDQSQTAQAAILYVNKAIPHVNSHE